MKKILLVDDNLDIVQIVEEVLAYEGFEVKAEMSGYGLIAIAEEYLPDLVILDYRLGDGNGGELCQQMKTCTALKHIPVIIFSAYIQPGSDLSDFGCDEVILKPFDLEVLAETVKRLLYRNAVKL
ncbi:Response regulator receiver domain-containing protein [Mucilaginibacter gossypiicola]|uniref:Response regulator receiver domain-containing protein n=1 Tax=Mucilaginibacter gossypiicola TaxID=551995 RepID=A0A1H8DM28_9SPHI|nr:response regulator [Mucilaginibacter gossypiicola]SEN08283.1 Response regulator receiver domain-containing protein [Mucilaginibacter gossypiicola]